MKHDEALLRSKKIPRWEMKSISRTKVTKHIPPFHPLSTQKHIIDLARLLSIASDSEMAQAKLKAGSPKAVPLGVFFLNMASSPHPYRRLLSLVAFTGQAGKVSQEVLSKVQVALAAGLHLRKRYLSIGRYWKHMTGNSHTSPFQRYCTEASGRALYSFVFCWPKSSNFAPGLHTWSNFNH